MSSVDPSLNTGAAHMSSSPHVKVEGGVDHYNYERSEDTDENRGDSVRNMKSYAWALLVGGVLGATFLFAFDNTIVADIQPHIVQDLGEIQKLPWITVAFELGAASANLFWGKLYGQFNNKVLFLSAILLFEVGSALCGAAPNMNVLIIGRLICGLGGNGIYLGTMNIISTFTTIKERPLYLSYFGIVWAAGTVLGPIIGGAFTDSSAGWRWSFYINICIGGILLPVYLVWLPSHSPVSGISTLRRIQNLDFIGITLFVSAFTAGIIATSFGGALFPWSSPRIIGPFICSGILFISFGLQQSFCFLTTPATRVFPVHLLQDWEMWILCAQTSASITALFLPVYFIPLFFQFVHTDSALEASIRLLPFICIGVLFCLLNGGLMGKIGYYMPWYLVGSALVIIGSCFMRNIRPETAASLLYGYTIVLGAGVGSYVQASFPVAQAKAKPEDSSNVLTLMGCAQLSGLAIGFSVANAIFINRVSDLIAEILPHTSRAEVQAAISGIGSYVFAELSSATRQDVLSAVSVAIGDVYLQVLAGAALSFVLALFLRRERLFL
ncbi:MAG: hypothetical protein M1821_006995 [Bathelium mastoideum]|nr:MAG: hypothetical protein M1821_006995 [Bathelium mastoideum]